MCTIWPKFYMNLIKPRKINLGKIRLVTFIQMILKPFSFSLSKKKLLLSYEFTWKAKSLTNKKHLHQPAIRANYNLIGKVVSPTRYQVLCGSYSSPYWAKTLLFFFMTAEKDTENIGRWARFPGRKKMFFFGEAPRRLISVRVFWCLLTTNFKSN